MSDEFVLSFLGKKTLTPIDKNLKRSSGSLMSSYGVLKNVSFWHDDVKVRLNFHVFEDLDFDFLIGHPIKALLKDAPKSGSLNFNTGKESLLVPVTRAIHCSTEDPPTIEPIEEVMATSILDTPDSDLERDNEGKIEDVTTEDEYSDETFELPETEKPSRPPIELKPLLSGLRYAFLNSDVEFPVIISDKLSEEEMTKLIAVLEKHRPVLGYALQDLKGISPALCTHRIPLDPEIAPSREPQ